METLVSYQLEAPIATITMDDGKVNALSLAMLSQLRRALDQAQADRAAVVITGRPGVFSAGFDLRVLRAGGDDAAAMVRGGFELAEQLLTFPAPVVLACTGHAIGLTMPNAAIEICRQRLAPSYLHRTLTLSELFAPDEAVTAGLLDRVVPVAELADAARGVAERLASLDRTAHAATKLRVRDRELTALRAAMAADAAALSGHR